MWYGSGLCVGGGEAGFSELLKTETGFVQPCVTDQRPASCSSDWTATGGTKNTFEK